MRTDDEERPLLALGDASRYAPSAGSSAPRLAAACILFCELCERLAYYSIVANLLIFLQNQLQFDSNSALTGTLIFSGSVYFTPIIGGWVSDTFLGRYNTLYASALVYACGCVLLPAVAFDYSALGVRMGLVPARVFYITSLTMVAIGTGGIKANVSPFGAHQVASSGAGEVQRFFSWFYWFVNIGSGIAYAIVAYIQQEVSFFIGYLIPAVAVLMSICLLLLPRRIFSHEARPTTSPLGECFSVIHNAWSSRSISIYKLPSFLDYAQISNGGKFTEQQVQGVRQVLLLLPLLLPFVGFWCIYNQAERMKLQVGSFTLPAASLQLFNSLGIILLTPLLDLVVYPCLRRCAGVASPSALVRIGIGFCLAIASVLAAALLEQQRKAELRASGGFQQLVAGVYFNASSTSVLLQIPQFLLIGAGEVFASATGMELVFSNSPDTLKSVTMGVFLAMNGMGSYFGSLLVAIVAATTQQDPWLPAEVNNGHLEYFCLLLAAIATLTLLIYLPVSVWYSAAYRRTLGGSTPGSYDRIVYGQLVESGGSAPSSGSVTLLTGNF